MKTLIYRIENDKKIGFFRSHTISNRKLKGLHKPPSPFEDIGIERSVKDYEKVGFLNDTQLYNWVKINDLKMLNHHNFKLKRIYREVTAIGQHQVLYTEGSKHEYKH